MVCERLIDSEWSILELCAERALHIQCQVGYPQHAQVPDPRAPEYTKALEAHERGWDLVWQKQAQRSIAIVPVRQGCHTAVATWPQCLLVYVQ